MEEGMRVSFTYNQQDFEGLVIQIQDGQVTVKLDSGYNIIVPESGMENVNGISQKSTREKHPVETEQDPSLPKITILHTGGTIASKVDYETGAVTAKFTPEELIELFPETKNIANLTTKVVSNIQSEDIRFGHYNLMARAALDAINEGSKGIIITHGTDTLHYSAAALSFALEDLCVPVVFVGAQRSPDRPSSDAAANLLGALRFITKSIPGVYVAMHETIDDNSIAIIRGPRARKQHTSSRDAFISVNAPLLGRVHGETVEIIDELPRKPTGKTRVLPFKESLRVGLWKTHPQSHVQELSCYDDFDGLLIEGSGLGHVPIAGSDSLTREEHPFIREKIRKLAKNMPVAITSQTIYGRINLNVYTNLRKLKELGVLGDGCDMHPETAFIKLAWLISNYDREQVRELYAQNLRGEISERSPLEDSHKATF